MVNVYEEFAMLSSSKVNTSKTTALWLGWEDRLDWTRSFHFQWVDTRMVYMHLGCPLGTRVTLKKQFECKIEGTFVQWKDKQLSSLGRLKVVKHILSSYLVFVALVLPLSLAQTRLKNFTRTLLVGQTMAWAQVTSAKEERGLGVESLKAKFDNLSTKWLLRLALTNPGPPSQGIGFAMMTQKVIHSPGKIFYRTRVYHTQPSSRCQ